MIAFLKRLTILPRWVIIVIDLVIINFSVLIGFLIRFNFDWVFLSQFEVGWSLFAVTTTNLISSLWTKSYAGIVRYTGIEDGKRIAISTFLSFAFLSIVNFTYSRFLGIGHLIPYSVILASFPVSFFFLFFYRLLVKELFLFLRASKDESTRKNVLIFGAGSMGLSVMHILESSPTTYTRLVGFLEDDSTKVAKKIHGVRIHHSDEFEKLVQENQIKELIVAVNSLSPERKSQLVDLAVRHQVKVRIVPPVEKWIKGELSLRQIKDINIEDLLGREVISIGNEILEKEIKGKRVLITGAAGSIGSEIARQVMVLRPESIFLLDQAESALFELQYELSSNPSIVQLGVCDIVNQQRVEQIFSEFRPHLVFHAAAYKHVPLMESNPVEAVTCNILGTRIVADAAAKYRSEKFVMISTDKAVNPTSVMGCSKRIAEIYVQSFNHHLAANDVDHTLFVTTRFGNVLGSNGSVVPIFKRQIEAGGPLTVTHPEIRRFFMTIPEACRLVLEAGVMGMGGEIFLFDMGEPIKIFDLAKRMIQLSGFELERDINIVFTGLRQGEKLYEELLANKENTIPTHHKKILKAKVTPQPYGRVSNYLDLMNDLIHDKNELKLVALMKEMVPEYKSNYSQYEVLDTVKKSRDY